MESLIVSYGLEFKSFNDLLIKHKAIIAGSSVLSIYLKELCSPDQKSKEQSSPDQKFNDLLIKHKAIIAGSSVLSIYLKELCSPDQKSKEQSSPDQKFKDSFVANDIDIWIPCNKNLNIFLPIYKDLFKYFTKYGYDDEEINKTEVTNQKSQYSNLPTGSASITKVIEFYNSENKRIQFIFINMNPIYFIKHTFDLSVCMTWYEPKSQTIETLDEYYTKQMKMYINYDKNFEDLHPKNKARIEKYIARGFTLIPKPLPMLKNRDERVFTKDFKIEANDVICLGDVNICEYLKESSKNIILKVAQSYYAYNRDELVKELEKFITRNYTLTPLKQAISINNISINNISIFKYDDYSIYNLRITNVKTNDNKHTLHSVKPMSVKEFESIYNEDGMKDGLIKRFYPTGVLKSETNYSNNLKQGIKKKYAFNGSLMEEIPYVSNKIEGVKNIYDDGKLSKTQNFKDNKLNGKTISYLKTELKIHIESNYVDNKLHGEYIVYGSDGNIWIKIHYDNGNAILPSVKE